MEYTVYRHKEKDSDSYHYKLFLVSDDTEKIIYGIPRFDKDGHIGKFSSINYMDTYVIGNISTEIDMLGNNAIQEIWDIMYNEFPEEFI